jgi:hypothetical protein
MTSWPWLGLACDDVQVVDDSGAAHVEQVLADARVAGAAALPGADMGQGVLDRDPFAELGPAGWGELAGLQLDQEPLVWVDLDAATAGTAGALLAQRARLAALDGELDLAARGKWHPTSLEQVSSPRQSRG